MIALSIMATVLGLTAYLCLAIKLGFWVGKKTESTGFDVGFYMMTVIGLITLPIAIAVQMGCAL